MAAWIFLMLAVPSAPEPPAPSLTLVWLDSSRLFPAVGLARLAEEIEELFRENGLSVRFHAAAENEDLRTIPEPRINAVVLPGEDRRFGLPANAMAVTLGTKGKKRGIFVLYPGIRRALGHRESERSPRHLSELARALARVVAHEMVHVLAPERGHADSGLMAETLSRELLLADRIELDGRSLALAVSAMRAWRAPARSFEMQAFRCPRWIALTGRSPAIHNRPRARRGGGGRRHRGARDRFRAST